MAEIIKKSIRELAGYTSPPQKECKVKLNQNESPFDVPQHIKDELAEQIKTTAWNRYPVNESPILLKKLAEWHGVKPESILLGNGSNQLFQTLLTAIILPGHKALYTPPTFSLYDLYMHIYEGEMIEVLHAPGEPYPIEQVIERIKAEQPKAIFLCSPNNPSGHEMELADVKRICDTAEGLVFFDEAYGEFSEQTAISLLRTFDNLIVSRTFSKAFSMAGLRFGYFVGPKVLIQELRKVNLPYNINLFTEMAAARLLDERQVMHKNIDYIKTERDRLFAELQRLPEIKVYPSGANFLLIQGPKELDLFAELKEHGVLVRDVSSYPLLQGCQRVTVGFRSENELFLETLRAILKSR